MVGIDLGERPGAARALQQALLERGYITSTGGGQREVLVLTPPLNTAERLLTRFRAASWRQKLRARRTPPSRDARRTIGSAPRAGSAFCARRARSTISRRWASRSRASKREHSPGFRAAGSRPRLASGSAGRRARCPVRSLPPGSRGGAPAGARRGSFRDQRHDRGARAPLHAHDAHLS